MKKTIIILVLMAAGISSGQAVNWKIAGQSAAGAASIRMGYDYGATVQAAYGRFVPIKWPVLLSFEAAVPMGEDRLDDYRISGGGQMPLLSWGAFVLTGGARCNLRRFESSLVRMLSFGADFSLTAGCYHDAWYAAAELGFDKAVSTHLKHSDEMREKVYADVQDGWYVPTGGHFYFGLQGSRRLCQNVSLTLEAGVTRAQAHDEEDMLPFYLNVGFVKVF